MCSAFDGDCPTMSVIHLLVQWKLKSLPGRALSRHEILISDLKRYQVWKDGSVGKNSSHASVRARVQFSEPMQKWVWQLMSVIPVLLRGARRQRWETPYKILGHPAWLPGREQQSDPVSKNGGQRTWGLILTSSHVPSGLSLWSKHTHVHTKCSYKRCFSFSTRCRLTVLFLCRAGWFAWVLLGNLISLSSHTETSSSPTLALAGSGWLCCLLHSSLKRKGGSGSAPSFLPPFSFLISNPFLSFPSRKGGELARWVANSLSLEVWFQFLVQHGVVIVEKETGVKSPILSCHIQTWWFCSSLFSFKRHQEEHCERKLALTTTNSSFPVSHSLAVNGC